MQAFVYFEDAGEILEINYNSLAAISSVRLTYNFRVGSPTGQIARYKTGQIKISRHGATTLLDILSLTLFKYSMFIP